MGLFHPFLDDASVRLIGVEAGGHGIETGQHAASLTGGRPGVLHGNRTYLLQDDDGQIIEAHSISAGLDYPGIGPEHSWLHDIGRVEYVSATDQEALDAFQLCTRTEGIIPALEPAHALAHVAEAGADDGSRPDHPDESLRPRRQGHFRRRRTSRREAVSRIAARFAELKRQGRGALIPFLEAWDPDQATSMAILRGMPEAGADLIEIGMPFTDPMADGPIIQAAGKRGLAAGVKVAPRADDGARVPPRRRDDAGRPDGLSEPDPVLRPGAVLRRCRRRRRGRADHRRSADRGSRHAAALRNANGLDFIRLVAPTTDDERLPQVLNGSSGFVYYVSITGITGTTQRDGRASGGRRSPRSGTRPTCRSRSASACARRNKRPAARVADAAVVASALIDTLSANLDVDGKALPAAVEKVLDQVRGAGGRSAQR